MPSTMAIGPCCIAVRAVLSAVSDLTTIIGQSLYPNAGGDVQQNKSHPYVAIESGSEIPFNTMGTPDASKYGGFTTVNVRLASEYRSEAQIQTMAGLVRAALDGQPVTVSGIGTLVGVYQSMQPLKLVEAGITTREWVLTFEYLWHQAA
jgi:hypothetical protein